MSNSSKYADALRKRDTTVTAEQWRERANEWADKSAASFERSDTDGFLSQWASDMTAREYRAWAALAEDGYRGEFAALFTADGDLIPDARQVTTQYGTSWVYDGPDGRPVWVNPSEARKGARRLANDKAKGHTIGTVRRDAFVVLDGADYTSVRPILVPIRDSEVEIVETVSEDHYRDWE